MALIQIQVNDDGALEAIAQLDRKMKTLDQAVRKSILYKERRTKQQFASETDPEGSAWAPLRPSTLRQKGGGQILTDTGATRGSVAGNSGGLTGTVAVNSDYAIYHQTGTSKMAQRKIVGWAAADIAKIRRIFESHLKG